MEEKSIGIFMKWDGVDSDLDWTGGVPLEPQNPYPFLRVILA